MTAVGGLEGERRKPDEEAPVNQRKAAESCENYKRPYGESMGYSRVPDRQEQRNRYEIQREVSTNLETFLKLSQRTKLHVVEPRIDRRLTAVQV